MSLELFGLQLNILTWFIAAAVMYTVFLLGHLHSNRMCLFVKMKEVNDWFEFILFNTYHLALATLIGFVISILAQLPINIGFVNNIGMIVFIIFVIIALNVIGYLLYKMLNGDNK